MVRTTQGQSSCLRVPPNDQLKAALLFQRVDSGPNHCIVNVAGAVRMRRCEFVEQIVDATSSDAGSGDYVALAELGRGGSSGHHHGEEFWFDTGHRNIQWKDGFGQQLV